MTDDIFLDYIAAHVHTLTANLNPDATARDLMKLPAEKRREYLETLQSGMDEGLITAGGITGYDYPAFWRAVIARIKELESEASDA